MIAYEEYIAELPEFEELDARERRFVAAYVFDPKRNGTQTAIDAGFSKSRKTAAVRASELVRNCKVSKAIIALQDWLRSEEKLLPRAVARLYQLAFEDSYSVRPGSGREPILPGMEDVFFVGFFALAFSFFHGNLFYTLHFFKAKSLFFELIIFFNAPTH